MLAKSLLEFDLKTIASMRLRDGMLVGSNVEYIPESGCPIKVGGTRYTAYGVWPSSKVRTRDIVGVVFNNGDVLNEDGYYPRGTKEVKEKEEKRC